MHLFEGDEVAVSKFKRRRWDAFLRGGRRASVRRRRRKKTKEYGLGMLTLNPWDWWKPCLGVIGPIVGTSKSIDNFDRWINLGVVSSN